MEAFGRAIAVSLGAIGVVVLSLFYKTASVRWQKEETVRSLSYAYAESIRYNKMFTYNDFVIFQEELKLLGGYRAEIVVYERRRFEGENGRIYLFTENRGIGKEEDRILSEGSYVRIVVTEPPKGELAIWLFGGGSTILAGGRIT